MVSTVDGHERKERSLGGWLDRAGGDQICAYSRKIV